MPAQAAFSKKGAAGRALAAKAPGARPSSLVLSHTYRNGPGQGARARTPGTPAVGAPRPMRRREGGRKRTSQLWTATLCITKIGEPVRAHSSGLAGPGGLRLVFFFLLLLVLQQHAAGPTRFQPMRRMRTYNVPVATNGGGNYRTTRNYDGRGLDFLGVDWTAGTSARTVADNGLDWSIWKCARRSAAQNKVVHCGERRSGARQR